MKVIVLKGWKMMGYNIRILIVLVILVIAGCSSSNRTGSHLCQDSLDRFLLQERSIGAIGRYNYNNLTSPYRIGSIPKTQQEWQFWNMMNSKLGKYLEQ